MRHDQKQVRLDNVDRLSRGSATMRIDWDQRKCRTRIANHILCYVAACWRVRLQRNTMAREKGKEDDPGSFA